MSNANFTILAHRGYWDTVEEQNTAFAFNKADNHGFGVETDIWVKDNQLVISHDSPTKYSPGFEILSKYNPSMAVALNVKSDNVHYYAKELTKLKGYYFCFDASVPESIRLIKAGIPVFTRLSEYEPYPAFYEQASGIWMDMFKCNHISAEEIKEHQANGKRVAIVSPELHKRPYMDYWRYLKENDVTDIMLCTDFPTEARNFFNWSKKR